MSRKKRWFIIGAYIFLCLLLVFVFVAIVIDVTGNREKEKQQTTSEVINTEYQDTICETI